LCETAGSKHNVFPQNTGLEYSCIIRMTKAEMTYNFSMFPIAKLYVREHGWSCGRFSSAKRASRKMKSSTCCSCEIGMSLQLLFLICACRPWLKYRSPVGSARFHTPPLSIEF
jgi:hypothetical protein